MVSLPPPSSLRRAGRRGHPPDRRDSDRRNRFVLRFLAKAFRSLGSIPSQISQKTLSKGRTHPPDMDSPRVMDVLGAKALSRVPSVGVFCLKSPQMDAASSRDAFLLLQNGVFSPVPQGDQSLQNDISSCGPQAKNLAPRKTPERDLPHTSPDLKQRAPLSTTRNKGTERRPQKRGPKIGHF